MLSNPSDRGSSNSMPVAKIDPSSNKSKMPMRVRERS